MSAVSSSLCAHCCMHSSKSAISLFHDLRHTFGSLLIQGRGTLAYLKEHMGHSSIQITVDTYGHLVPGADIACVDSLDSRTKPQQSANQTQMNESRQQKEGAELAERNWPPPRDSNPDMLIQSQKEMFQ